MLALYCVLQLLEYERPTLGVARRARGASWMAHDGTPILTPARSEKPKGHRYLHSQLFRRPQAWPFLVDEACDVIFQQRKRCNNGASKLKPRRPGAGFKEAPVKVQSTQLLYGGSYLKNRRNHGKACPECPSTQYLRFLIPKSIPFILSGTRDLKRNVGY